LARIIFGKVGYRLHHQAVKKLWQDSPEAVQGELALGA
jgi:hypothetical protein